MPVSKISIFGERSRNAGGSRWIGQRSASVGDRAAVVDRLADHVPEAAERRLPTGTEIGPPVSTHVDSAREAVGRVHGDGADAIVAEMLLHLRDQRAASLDSRAADLGKVVERERGTLDLDDLAQGSVDRVRKTRRWTTPWISTISEIGAGRSSVDGRALACLDTLGVVGARQRRT